MPPFDWHSLFWPAIVCAAILVVWAVWSRRSGRAARVERLKLRSLLGLLEGKPEAFAELKRLLDQPPPPPEVSKWEQVRQIVLGPDPGPGPRPKA
jgi:hypothetical protein